MASLGHVAIGLAVGRAQGKSRNSRSIWILMAFYSALALLPDVDVIAFRLGVPYEAPFGHRGAFHSITFAACVGALVGIAAAPRRKPWLGYASLASIVVASHGLLDAMTDGGLGIALFWPFTNHRYFLPWTPIPVAPIGRSMLSAYGLSIALTELWMFSPLLLYALFPRRSSAVHGAPAGRSSEPADSARKGWSRS